MLTAGLVAWINTICLILSGLFLLLAAATMLARRAMPLALVAALAMTGVWLGFIALFGQFSFAALVMESGRNLGWLWFLAHVAGAGAPTRRLSPIGWIYVGLTSVQALLLVLLALPALMGFKPVILWVQVESIMMLVLAGGLVLLHNVHAAGHRDRTQDIGLPVIALGLIWGYDLNLYAISYFGNAPAMLLAVLRPLPVALALGALTLALLRPAAQPVRLSRPAALRSIGATVVAAWLALLALLSILLPGSGHIYTAAVQGGLLLTGAGLGILILLSRRFRSYAQVWIAKHFFAHRYDYRAEWMRFSATLHTPVATDAGVHDIEGRVVRALSDIVGSPAGHLILRNDGGFAASLSAAPALAMLDWAMLGQYLSREARIIQIDEARAGTAPPREIAAIPDGLLAAREHWILVPLLHGEQLDAMLVIDRPPLDRTLDWEDFDLLRAAARQAALHLAEARSSAALAESARFEEFHRRFAFVMHDVKNLASQMALLSRNAERHGQNPAFREDMVATLKYGAERLGQLTDKLRGQERVQIDTLQPVELGALVARAALTLQLRHAVEIHGAGEFWVDGHGATIEQLVGLIAQNAMDASDDDQPVQLELRRADGQICLDIRDRGCGMSDAYIQHELFRPFSSTKAGGFGIGAFQARQLAEAMGGTLSVTSREGAGTCFTLCLKPAAGPASESAAA